MGRTSRQAGPDRPTRERILGTVRGASDPPSAQDLAESLGIHVTTARFHLEQLESSGLVARDVTRSQRRGRPTVRYRAGALDVADVREQMIVALADATAARGRGVRDRALAAGRRWAERLRPRGHDPSATVTDGLARLGFAPEAVGDEVLLHACPFRDAARDNPDVVCRVHLGLAQGLADSSTSGGGVRVGLVPFVEPELCVVKLEQGGR